MPHCGHLKRECVVVRCNMIVVRNTSHTCHTIDKQMIYSELTIDAVHILRNNYKTMAMVALLLYES